MWWWWLWSEYVLIWVLGLVLFAVACWIWTDVTQWQHTYDMSQQAVRHIHYQNPHTHHHHHRRGTITTTTTKRTAQPRMSDFLMRALHLRTVPSPRSDESGRSRAVFVGINYTGTSEELNGCIADAHRMRHFLTQSMYGYTQTLLLSDDPAIEDPTTRAALMPTVSAIRTAIHWLVTDAQPGDRLFFHYSGHGTRIPQQALGPWLCCSSCARWCGYEPKTLGRRKEHRKHQHKERQQRINDMVRPLLIRSSSGHGVKAISSSSSRLDKESAPPSALDEADVETDGYDECIVPVDFHTNGVLTDNELFRILVWPLHGTGAQLTAVFDCCNSGSTLDLAYQYQAGERGQFSAVETKLQRALADVDATYIGASRDDELAVDVKADDGQSFGVLTRSLVESLEANGHRVTANSLIQDLTRRIHRMGSDQHPQIASTRALQSSTVIDWRHL